MQLQGKRLGAVAFPVRTLHLHARLAGDDAPLHVGLTSTRTESLNSACYRKICFHLTRSGQLRTIQLYMH